MGITSFHARRQLWPMAGITQPLLAGFERRQRQLGGLGIDRTSGNERLASFLIRSPSSSVPQQVDDAGLDDRVREHGGGGVRETFEAIDDG